MGWPLSNKRPLKPGIAGLMAFQGAFLSKAKAQAVARKIPQR